MDYRVRYYSGFIFSYNAVYFQYYITHLRFQLTLELSIRNRAGFRCRPEHIVLQRTLQRTAPLEKTYRSQFLRGY